MRILKFSAAALMAVLAAGSLQARRTDSDVQTKAREALQQAEADQDAQAAAAKNATTPPAKKKKTTVITAPAATAPAATTPAASVNAAATPPGAAASSGAVSTDTEAKARQQLRDAESQQPSTPAPDADAAREEHLRELEAARAAKAAAATPPPAATPVPAATPPPAAAPVYRSGGLTPDAEERAREAMHAAEANLNTQPNAKVAVTAPPPMSTKPKIAPPASSLPKPAGTSVSTTPAPANYPGVTQTPPPAMTPKEARLEDLKNKYKMDQITPQQYYDQKAKILAEP